MLYVWAYDVYHVLHCWDTRAHTHTHTVTNTKQLQISTQVGTCHSQCADSIYCLWTDWKDASAALRRLLLRKLWENWLITWAAWITWVAVRWWWRWSKWLQLKFLRPSLTNILVVSYLIFFFDSCFVFFVIVYVVVVVGVVAVAIVLWVLCKPSTWSTSVHDMFLFFSMFFHEIWGSTRWNRM